MQWHSLRDLILTIAVLATCADFRRPSPQLSPPAVELQTLARRKDLGPEYMLSKDAASEPEMLQRATEILWPRRQRLIAPALIALVEEQLPAGCVARVRLTWVQYADCR